MAAHVLILLGSDKDRSHLERGLPYFERFGLTYDLVVSSAHRQPDQTAELARRARDRGYKVIICVAGMAAHLGGVVAAHTTLPVLGVPIGGSALGGVDALYSFVQMPAGIPVATLAIGPAGFVNAAIFAAQVLSLSDPSLAGRLSDFKQELAKG
jgi:phosphoribosylaminoimidazole carboxylase PurE protein